MAKENTRGNHQPYWYESFVGLLYVIDLFDEKSNIESVEFQSIETQKLDDVVVNYKDKSIECIQVKSTEQEEKIGFETLVNKYLEDWSKEWKELKNKQTKVNVTLFTNRRITEEYGAKGKYIRPKLDEFWKYIKEQLMQVTTIDEIQIPDRWNPAWEKYLDKIEHLKNQEQDLRLEFMKSFYLKLEQEDYLELQDRILKSISEKYNIDEHMAKKFLNDLKSELSNWATSDGKRKYGNKITTEIVLKTVNHEEKYLANNHYIPYNKDFFISRENFIKEIIDEIKKTDKKVMFLKGAPGSGKTTTISYIAYMSEIDFRFYSYKPFNLSLNNGGHELSKSRDLWCDLYYQIKQYVIEKNRDIKDFKLVPYVEWIKQDNLKYEVLRLLKLLSEMEKRRIFVAIDGIDHAARSEDIDNFLKSFICPEIIPTNVFFLITGQPNYKEYPEWLLDDGYVISKNMMKISEEDIRQLYLSSKIDKTIFDESTLVDIVKNRVCGNTLSAIYAVKEAEECSDMEEFNRRLSERNLGYTIENYYSSIWTYCLKYIDESIRDAIDLQLATIFSVAPKGISIELLKNIFDSFGLNEQQWRLILNRMKPLVSMSKELYFIEINDVKVYLNRRVNKLYEHKEVEKVILKLAKYYLNCKNELYEKHYTSFKILKKIENEEYFMLFFNIEFAIEAIVINQSRSDLREQVNYVIKKAYEFKSWDILFNVFHVLRVFEQSKKTIEWYGNIYSDSKCKYEYLDTEICKHPNDLDYSFLCKIFKDAENLFRNNELSRAQLLLGKYLENKTMEDIVSVITAGNVTEDNFSMKYRERIIDIGKICRYCEFVIKSDKELLKLLPNQKKFVEFFIDGWLKASKDFDNINEDFTFKIPILINEKLLDYLYELVQYNKWESISSFTQIILEKEIPISYVPISLQLGSWLIQKEKIDAFNELFDSQLKNKDIIEEIKKIDITQYNNKKIKLLAFCNVAFIYGFKNWKLFIDDTLIKCYYQYLDYKEVHLLKCLLNLNYFYGFLFNSRDLIKKSQDTKEIKDSLQSLLCREAIYTSWINTAPFVKDSLCKLVNFCQLCGDNFEKELFEQFLDKFKFLLNDNNWSLLFSKDLCVFLYDRGEKKNVKTYIQKFLDKSSHIWQLDKSTRDSIISELIYCGQKIGIDGEYIESLKEWSKWFSISYIDDREYILNDLYDLLQVLLKRNPEKWENYFPVVVNLTEIIRRIGSDDTKLEIEIELATAALNCSQNDFWKFIINLDYTKSDATYILNKVMVNYLDNKDIKLMNKEEVQMDDIILIWEYVYRNTNDDDYYSQRELYRLKESIINYLNRFSQYDSQINRFMEINSVKDRLAELSKVNVIQKNKKTYEEIISNINEKVERNSFDFECCIELIDYIENYRPKTMSIDIDRIIGLIKMKFNTYSIGNTYIEEIYDRIFKFIDDEIKWEIVYFHTVDKLTTIESYDRWISYITINLARLLIMKSNELKTEELEKQIKLILEMHERILTGNYKYMHIIEKKNELKKCDLYSWNEFFNCINNLR